MRILHAADIHLDSPLAGLRQRAGARADELANATRRAFENLIQYAIDQSVDLLVLAGDNYDGKHKDFSSLQFFAGQMRRLYKAGIRVVMIRGNHDAENQLVLTLPEGVHLLAASQPETLLFDDLKLAVHGQSYATRDVSQNLAALYPEPVAGLFNLGVLHTAVEGYGGTHAAYAPCSVKDLAGKSYDYWALGHVHTRTEIETAPFIIYPGNLQARHVNEPGKKGATLITVNGGTITGTEHVPLDVVRWARIAVDVSGAETLERVAALMTRAIEAAVDGADRRTLAARIVLEGEAPVHRLLKTEVARIDAEAAEAALAAGDVWIERVDAQTTAPLERAPSDEAIKALNAALETLRRPGANRQDMLEAVLALPNRYTAGLRRDAGLDPLDDLSLDAILNDGRDILLSKLTSKG